MARQMPSFAKSPPQLIARFSELAALVPGATQRQMFGYPSCVLNGNMFMGLHTDRMFLRLSDADIAEFTAKHHAQPFEPMPGRPMKGYMVVPAQLLGKPAVEDWVQRAYRNASTLPAKSPKKPAAKKR